MSAMGDLRRLWHPVALSGELRAGRSLKRSHHGRPLLLWRDLAGVLHAWDDCCAHRRGPLQVIDYRSNRVACTYHGWEYDAKGQVSLVPSNPPDASMPRCSIPRQSIMERHGFVWLLPDATELADVATARLDDMLRMEPYKDWTVQYKRQDFATSEQLLTENFLDPTHTPMVHGGLIRSRRNSAEHEVTITTHRYGVRADYEEKEERVGFGARLLYGRSMLVHHIDEFLLPDLVRVAYQINGEECFLALIACISLGPTGSGRTLALVQLRHRFGRMSRLLQPIISLVAGAVLRQDRRITALQFTNQTAFANTPEHLVRADAMASRVARLRQSLSTPDDKDYPGPQVVRLRF